MAGHTLRTIDYSMLQQCMHCGMCLPTCPTYDQTRRERNSPRGRIALRRAVADGALDITHEFAEEMSYCLGCLACQTACPAGVNYAELLGPARGDLESQHLEAGTARTFWRAATLGFLFMRPTALRAVGRVVGAYQRNGLEALARKIGVTRLPPPALRRRAPHTPRPATRASDAAHREEVFERAHRSSRNAVNTGTPSGRAADGLRTGP